jgi:hypothetical protein
MHLNDYSISPQKKVNKIKTNKVNANNISEKNNDGGILLDIDFNLLPQETRIGSLFNAGKFHNEENNFIKENSFGIGGTNMNKREHVKPIKQESEVKNDYSNVEKSLNSLAQVDITGILESINFDKGSDSVVVPSIEFIQNKSQITTIVNSINHNLDNSIASYATYNIKTDNVLANIDFNLSKNIPKNFITNENIFKKDNPPVNNKGNTIDFSKFEELLQIGTKKDEDKFDLNLIRKQVRGVIIV